MVNRFSEKSSSGLQHILVAGRTLCGNEVMEAGDKATESKVYDRKVCQRCEELFLDSHEHNFEQTAPSSVPLK